MYQNAAILATLLIIYSAVSSLDKLFIGWFGPWGLASIVFAIIVSNERLHPK